MFSVWVLAAWPVAIFLLYSAYVAVQRLFFSPLRDIPGPFLAKLGSGWHLWATLKGPYVNSILAAHRKYGPLVRVGDNEVSVCTHDAVKLILSRTLDKGDWYKIFAIPDSTWTNNMCETNASKVIDKKKRIIPGFSLSNILRSEPAIDDLLSTFQTRMDEMIAQKKPVPLDDWFAYYAFDVLAVVTFSRAFGFLDEGADVGGCIATGRSLVTYLSVMAYMRQWHDAVATNPIIRWLDLQPMRRVMETTKTAVEERERSEKAGRDMIEQWKNVKNGKQLTRRELLETANANVAAGGDTLAAQLQSFVYLLLKNPHCLIKLRTELDEASKAEGFKSPVQWSTTQELPYFQACIKETLRLHALPANSITRIVPKEGLQIGDKFLPSGTIVSVNTSVFHHNPDFWGSNVEEYMPERWLKEDSAVKESYYFPFGVGYMQCPGRNLGLIELNKLMATFLLNYDIELAEGYEQWKIARGFLNRPYGWNVVLKKRR